MLYLVVIVLAAVLLFVLFAKRPVNMNGLQANWQVPIDPPKPAQPSAQQTSQPVAPPPAEVTSVNFNDVFAAKPAPKSDRPSA